MIDSPVDEIKNKLDIVEVISGYLNLKKAGKDYKACCPFHSEKTPSFFVSPSKQIWHCFGCGVGGDMFSFVMQMDGVEFADALRTLAQRAGVVLKQQDPKLKSQRSILYKICQEASEWFEKNLQKNKSVLDYLKKRAILPKTIKEFKIGYALDSWNALYDHLIDLGYKVQDIEKAGLVVKKQKHYDRFRGRIIFPICDISGQVIGFTGRIFRGNESIAKYINSPESLIFNKSQILYGLDKAKVEIRKEDQCILVEGQIDVVMSHQAGKKNTIATSGTALTAEHLIIIKRYTDNILLAFDNDTAGEGATKRGIDLLRTSGLNVKVILMSGDKDPADIIKKNPKTWEQSIKEAKSIMEFYFDRVFAKYNPKKIEDKRQIAKELLPEIKRIANEIERAHWLQVLALKLNIQEKLLNEALGKVKTPNELIENKSASAKADKKSRRQNIEENLLGLVLKYPENLEYLKKNLKPGHFLFPQTKKIFQSLKKNTTKTEKSYYLDHIIFQVEHYELEGKDILKEIKFYTQELITDYNKKKLSEKSLAIKEAESKGDKKQVKKLTEEFNNLLKK